MKKGGESRSSYVQRVFFTTDCPVLELNVWALRTSVDNDEQRETEAAVRDKVANSPIPSTPPPPLSLLYPPPHLLGGLFVFSMVNFCKG